MCKNRDEYWKFCRLSDTFALSCGFCSGTAVVCFTNVVKKIFEEKAKKKKKTWKEIAFNYSYTEAKVGIRTLLVLLIPQ